MDRRFELTYDERLQHHRAYMLLKKAQKVTRMETMAREKQQR